MSSFSVRHYIPEKDLHTLSMMLTEIEQVDRDGEDTSEEYLLASLQWDNYRPAQDVWVAEADGKLAGYAVALEQPSRHCTLYVVVHPDQRRQGLGSELLGLILARARELGSKTLIIYANERNVASNLFLRHHGFAAVGSSGTMKLEESPASHALELPEGFTLKPYSEINETIVLLNALNDCYQDMWGHQHTEQRSEEEIRSPRFLKYYQAEDILLLLDPHGDVAGFCSLKPAGKRDEQGNTADLLDAPGVIKKHREEGYQQQLVLAGIEHLRKKATRPIILEFWGESAQALAGYRALGFEMLNHYVTYNKELE